MIRLTLAAPDANLSRTRGAIEGDRWSLISRAWHIAPKERGMRSLLVARANNFTVSGSFFERALDASAEEFCVKDDRSGVGGIGEDGRLPNGRVMRQKLRSSVGAGHRPRGALSSYGGGRTRSAGRHAPTVCEKVRISKIGFRPKVESSRERPAVWRRARRSDGKELPDR